MKLLLICLWASIFVKEIGGEQSGSLVFGNNDVKFGINPLERNDRQFIPTLVLHKRLPWAARVMFPLINSKYKIELSDAPISSSSDEISTFTRVKTLFPILNHPWVRPVLQKLSPIWQKVIFWIKSHTHWYIFALKAFIGVNIALAIIRRVAHWYTGIAEYEILLDKEDHDYQLFGAHFDGHGLKLLSNLDSDLVNSLGYEKVFQRLCTAISRPCFPHAMKQYAVETGGEIAEILSDLDLRVRQLRRKVASASRSESSSSSSKLYRLQQESFVINTLQQALTMLSAAQADAYLRSTRMSLLSEANTCEDLLRTWREKIAQKSQTLRIPFVQSILARIIGFSTTARLRTWSKMRQERRQTCNSNNTTASSQNDVNQSSGIEDIPLEDLEQGYPVSDDSLHTSGISFQNMLTALNAREKVLVLEELLASFYATAGDIQSHLQSLEGVMISVKKRESRQTTAQEESNSNSQENMFLQPVENWITRAADLSQRTVDLLSFQHDYHQTDEDEHHKMQAKKTSFGHNGKAQTLLHRDTLALLCLMCSEAYDHYASTNVLVATVVLPYSAKAVVESGLLQQHTLDSTFQTFAAVAAPGQSVKFYPWTMVDHTIQSAFLNDDNNHEDDHVHHESAASALWMREVRYKVNQSSQNNHAFAFLGGGPKHHEAEQVWIQVVNTSPYLTQHEGDDNGLQAQEQQIKEAATSEKYLMATFQDFSNASSHFIACNATTRWSISSSNTSHSKLKVTLDLQVKSSLYRFFVASAVLDETKRMVDSWRQQLLTRLEQQEQGKENNSEDVKNVIAVMNKLRQEKLQRWQQHQQASIQQEEAVQSTAVILPSTTRQAEEEVNQFRLIADSSIRNNSSNSPSVRLKGGGSQSQQQPSTSQTSTAIRAYHSPHLHRLQQLLLQHEQHIHHLRGHWRRSGSILRDLQSSPTLFAQNLQRLGLQKRSQQGVLAVLRWRVILSLAFWTSLAVAGFELNKRSEDISWGMDVLIKNVRDFVDRRITTPTLSIVNDVILNKKMKITDQAALLDAQRSLRAMIYDFLLQHW